MPIFKTDSEALRFWQNWLPRIRRTKDGAGEGFCQSLFYRPDIPAEALERTVRLLAEEREAPEQTHAVLCRDTPTGMTGMLITREQLYFKLSIAERLDTPVLEMSGGESVFGLLGLFHAKSKKNYILHAAALRLDRITEAEADADGLLRIFFKAGETISLRVKSRAEKLNTGFRIYELAAALNAIAELSAEKEKEI